ncbi:unnamed protein product [Orchesella dallaii]|uniref:Ionotropic glutamate receptor C-terminal domain-containing protein n=1 Tax=Orchesella dallaii TaxID=48710 RepID=A0ABP1RIM2_9HEXA
MSHFKTSHFNELYEPVSQLENQDDKVISALLHQQFPDYSLVIVQDNHSHNDESVRSILAPILHPSSSDCQCQLKTTYLIKISGADCRSAPVEFLPAAFHLNRRGYQQKIVIIMLNDFQSAVMSVVSNIISPVYIPITRKDEDFYIFKAESHFHRRLLLMKFPHNVKFKIAIGRERVRNVILVNTICFFCNSFGSPKLVEFPVKHSGIPMENFNYFPDLVNDLNGKCLEVSIPYVRSEIEADPPWLGMRNAKRGNWKNLFEDYLMVKFNFTYHMFVSTGADGKIGGGGTGTKLLNGSWTGVVADLISGRAQLGVAASNTNDRRCLTFVTSQPLKYFSPVVFIRPFSITPWLGIFFTAAMVLTLCYIASKVQRKTWVRPIIPLLVSTLLEQSNRSLPTTLGFRFILAIWLYFVMVMMTLYRSKLVTLLAFPITSEIPKTIEELVYSDYKIGFVKHGESAYGTLASSTDPVYVQLIKEMEIFTDDGLNCLNKAVNHKYGCIPYDFALFHLVVRNLSDYEESKIVFAPARTYNIYTGIGTEAKSIFKINFSKWLSYANSFHLPDVWEKMDMYKNVRLPNIRWWVNTNQVNKLRNFRNNNEDFVSGKPANLRMAHTAGLFYVLLMCLFLSVLVYVIEIAWDR